MKSNYLMTNEEMRKQFEVNFYGTFYCIKALLPLIKLSNYGYILNIGSLVAKVSFADNNLYAATKFALLGFTEGFRYEMKKSNIKVGIFLPGLMERGKIMKSYRKELLFNLPSRRGYVNITSQVQECINASGIKEGLVLINAMNITASVFVNDDEAGLHVDFEKWLEGLAPEKPYGQYNHNGYEDNADAHLKRQLMGREVVAAITNGKLDFGTWEQIFYGEYDGKRQKRVLVKIIGD